MKEGLSQDGCTGGTSDGGVGGNGNVPKRKVCKKRARRHWRNREQLGLGGSETNRLLALTTKWIVLVKGKQRVQDQVLRVQEQERL